MKMSSKVRTFLCAILAVTVLTAFAAMAGGGAGSQTDPLVTLSYLTNTFTTQVMDKVGNLLTDRNAALNKELTDKIAGFSLPGHPSAETFGGSYAVVELAAGQALYGEAGCEILLRSGSAICAGTGSAALADATTGGSVSSGGALPVNHLCLMTDSGSVSTREGAVLLARGSYTVG